MEEIHAEALEDSCHVCSSCNLGGRECSLCLLVVRWRRAVNRSGAQDPGSLDHGEPGELHSESDLLGTTPGWNPCCCSRGGRLSVGEETTERGNERRPPLPQALTNLKRRRRSADSRLC